MLFGSFGVFFGWFCVVLDQFRVILLCLGLFWVKLGLIFERLLLVLDCFVHFSGHFCLFWVILGYSRSLFLTRFDWLWGFFWLVLVSLGLFLLGLGLLLARFILFWVVWLVLAHFMSLFGLLWHVLGCWGSFRENLSRFGSTWINLALFLDCFGLFWIF